MKRSAVSAIALSAALLVGGGLQVRQSSAGDAPSTCNRLEPTIVSNDGVVYGTGGSDVIFAVDVKAVYGFGGDDSICVDGAGLVYAGSGNDYVATLDDVGGECPFAIYGGSGADNLNCANEIYGETGDDRLSFGGLLSGGPGNDSLDSGFTLCDGGSGTDTATNCFGSVKSVEHLS
jgi:hypothetical protein